MNAVCDGVNMSSADRLIRASRRIVPRGSGWIWFICLSVAWGVVIVVVALTVPARCINSDPACVFHPQVTLVQGIGPGILAFVGTPLALSLLLAALLHRKATRRSRRADRAALGVATLSFLICLLAMLVEGIVVLPEAALTVCAVATTPFPPDPADPLAGSGH